MDDEGQLSSSGLNIYHNLSRWVLRRKYQRLVKPRCGGHLRVRVQRRRAFLHPRVRMLPGIHIRIISPISLLLRLRDAYSRKVVVVTSTVPPKESTRGYGEGENVVKLPKVRELMAEE